jgi:hypothetical protein
MPLRDDIVAHSKSVLAELDAVHDYYANSKAAWRIVQKQIRAGRKLKIRNAVTGRVTTERELPGMAARYVADYLTSSTFQQFVSLFEDFLFGIMRHWLLAFPQSLARKQIPVSVVLEASDLDAVKLAAVNRELNELNYKKVREWFSHLNGLVSLGCPTADEIDRLAEIKATRDVSVHNRGIASLIYEEKAGPLGRAKAGERLEMPEHYHLASWQLIRKVVQDLSAASVAKAGP